MITQKHAVAAATRSRRAGSRTCTRRRRRRAAGTRPAATRAPRAPRSSRARRGSRRARTYAWLLCFPCRHSMTHSLRTLHAIDANEITATCVACLPRRHGITYSRGTLDAIDAGLRGRRARTGADRTARARRRTPRPARRCTVDNAAPSRARRTGSPVSSGLVVSRLRTSRVTPSPRRAKDAGAAPWYTATWLPWPDAP